MPRKGQRQPKTPQQLARWRETINQKSAYEMALWRAKLSSALKGRDIAGPETRAKAAEARRAA